jgi:TRAP-type uncharacterized transport system substrate-binding protein
MKRHFGALVLAAGLAAALAGSAAAAELKFMTGPQGGSWIPLGGQLKDLWEKSVPGLTVQQSPGAGIANVRGVEEGKTDVGFGNSISTVDAVAGREPFKKPHANVCNVATLYPQYYQMVVPANSGINSIKDLKGKGVTTQQRGNTGEAITQQILQVSGLTYNDVKMSFVLKVIGYATHLVVSCKTDESTVYALTKTIAQNVPALTAVVSAIKGLDAKAMAEDIGVPFHKGAAKFYKEAGVNVVTN